MYTGTLITDLLATVQQAEQNVRRHQVALEDELRAIFSMQIPIIDGDQLLMGAA
jgi:hypothetical protein